MRWRFIGTGGAFDHQLGNSALLLEIGNETWLIDCGHSVYPALRRLGLADQITGIFITHTHDDHVGSLGSLLAHQRYVAGKHEPMPIYVPTAAFRQHLAGYLRYVLGAVDKYVSWRDIDQQPGVEALDTSGYHAEGVPSFAYAFSAGDQRLAYSGDLAEPAVLFSWLQQMGWQGATVLHDVTFVAGNTHHAYYKSVEPYQEKFTVYGYHCDPAQKPSDCTLPLAAEERAFLLGAN